ncbi:hypothetical protein D3C86_1858990 [compost metagenome]
MMVRTPKAARASVLVVNSPRNQRIASALSCSLPSSKPRQYAAITSAKSYPLTISVSSLRWARMTVWLSIPAAFASDLAWEMNFSTMPCMAPPSGFVRVDMFLASSE